MCLPADLLVRLRTRRQPLDATSCVLLVDGLPLLLLLMQAKVDADSNDSTRRSERWSSCGSLRQQKTSISRWSSTRARSQRTRA